MGRRTRVTRERHPGDVPFGRTTFHGGVEPPRTVFAGSPRRPAVSTDTAPQSAGRFFNEAFLLLGALLIGVVATWMLVATVLAPALSGAIPALEQGIVVESGPMAGGVIVAGWPRAWLIVGLTLVEATVGLVVYAARVRPALAARGIVSSSDLRETMSSRGE